MDGFTLFVVAAGAVVFGIFWALGAYHPKTGAQVLDWKPTRSVEDEVQLELEDVEQMLEAQNRRRRASGRPELSEEGLRAEVGGELAARNRRAKDYEPDAGTRPDS